MNHTQLFIIGAGIACGTLLAGCTAANPPEPITTPEPVGQAPVNETANPQVTPVVQGDLEAADRAIDNQNLDTDFPPVNQTDLEK